MDDAWWRIAHIEDGINIYSALYVNEGMNFRAVILEQYLKKMKYSHRNS